MARRGEGAPEAPARGRGAAADWLAWLDCDREGEAIAYEVVEVCARAAAIGLAWRPSSTSTSGRSSRPEASGGRTSARRTPSRRAGVTCRSARTTRSRRSSPGPPRWRRRGGRRLVRAVPFPTLGFIGAPASTPTSPATSEGRPETGRHALGLAAAPRSTRPRAGCSWTSSSRRRGRHGDQSRGRGRDEGAASAPLPPSPEAPSKWLGPSAETMDAAEQLYQRGYGATRGRRRRGSRNLRRPGARRLPATRRPWRRGSRRAAGARPFPRAGARTTRRTRRSTRPRPSPPGAERPRRSRFELIARHFPACCARDATGRQTRVARPGGEASTRAASWSTAERLDVTRASPGRPRRSRPSTSVREPQPRLHPVDDAAARPHRGGPEQDGRPRRGGRDDGGPHQDRPDGDYARRGRAAPLLPADRARHGARRGLRRHGHAPQPAPAAGGLGGGRRPRRERRQDQGRRPHRGPRDHADVLRRRLARRRQARRRDAAALRRRRGHRRRGCRGGGGPGRPGFGALRRLRATCTSSSGEQGSRRSAASVRRAGCSRKRDYAPKVGALATPAVAVEETHPETGPAFFALPRCYGATGTRAPSPSASAARARSSPRPRAAASRLPPPRPRRRHLAPGLRHRADLAPDDATCARAQERASSGPKKLALAIGPKVPPGTTSSPRSAPSATSLLDLGLDRRNLAPTTNARAGAAGGGPACRRRFRSDQGSRGKALLTHPLPRRRPEIEGRSQAATAFTAFGVTRAKTQNLGGQQRGCSQQQQSRQIFLRRSPR